MAAPLAAAAAKAGAAAQTAGDVKDALPNAPRKRRVRMKTANKSTYGPVATTLTILMGMGFLKAWLGDEEKESTALPDRKWFVNMALLGFGLSLMVEVAPKMGKNMAYLILTSGVFIQGEPLIKRLQEGGEVKPKAAPKARPQGTSPLPGVRTVRA